MPSASSNRPRRPTTALASDVELRNAPSPDENLDRDEDEEIDDQGGFLIRHGQELAGIGVGTLAVLIFVSLMSYQPALPPEPAGNLIGPAGAFFADTAYWLLGASSYFFVILAAAGARALLVGKRLFGRWEEATGYGLGLLMLAMLFELLSPDASWFGHQLGGWIGEGLAIGVSAIIGRVGATVCGVSLLLMAFVLVTESSVVAVAGAIWARVAAWGEGVSRDARPGQTESDLIPAGPRLRYESETTSGDNVALERGRAKSDPVVPSVSEPVGAIPDNKGDLDESGDKFASGIHDVPAAENDAKANASGEDWAFDDHVEEDDLPAQPRKSSLTQSIANTFSRLFGGRTNETLVDDSEYEDEEFEIGGGDVVGVATESAEWANGWSLGAGNDIDEDDRYGDDYSDASDDRLDGHRFDSMQVGVVPVFSITESPTTSDDENSATGVFKRPSSSPSRGSTRAGELGTWEAAAPSSENSPSAVIRRPDAHPQPQSPAPQQPQSPPSAVVTPVPRAERAESVEPSPDQNLAPAENRSSRAVVTDDEQSVWVGEIKVSQSKLVVPGTRSQAAPSPLDDDDERPPTVEISSADVVSVTPQEAVAAGPIIFESEALTQRKKAEDLDRELPRHRDNEEEWQFPPMHFLRYEESPENSVDHERLKELARRLEEVLASFKVAGAVTGICPGPVVTRFEFEPETGTKLSKISGLSDDIAMALKAVKVRIIAPIPGKGCVGIEVPNETRENVYLKEILADERFVRSRSPLTVALGKDIEGFPVVADFAKMPHLLIAGTTGSGKSVTVNAMITSILYNASPDDVKMILIDPKQLEFAIYQDMPHLMLPVVTDPAKANTALQWAVTEMELRYKLMAEMRVRNLAGYNQKLKELERNAIEAIANPSIRDPQIALLDQIDENDELLH
jgi:DNA segregation ATPase FtsK/SpoIIIE-like protein